MKYFYFFIYVLTMMITAEDLQLIFYKYKTDVEQENIPEIMYFELHDNFMILLLSYSKPGINTFLVSGVKNKQIPYTQNIIQGYCEEYYCENSTEMCMGVHFLC